MQKTFVKNIRLLKIFFFLLIIMVILQLFRLQVIEHQRWGIRAHYKNILRTTYQASRGSVFFADGSPFAVSQLAYAIYALPQEFKSNIARSKKITPEQFARDFAELTGLNKDIILETIKTDKVYVSIGKRIDPKIVDELRKKYPMNLNLWNFEEQFIRIYPNKEIGAKIIGFVRQSDNGEEIGQYGIEQYFDGVLRGSDGIFEGVKDSVDNIIVNQNFQSITSRNGIDITLTVDRNIQAMIEEEAKKYNDLVKAKETTIVVMEPNTGRIIASANYPTYDPNRFWEGELIDCNIEYYKVLHEKCNPKVSTTPTNNTNQSDNNNQVIYPDGYLEKLKELEEEQKKLEQQKKELEQMINPSSEDELTDEEKQRLSAYNKSVQEIFRKKSLPVSEVYRDAANSTLYEPGSVVKVLTLSIAYNYNTIPRDPDYPLGGHQGCEQVVDVKLCTYTKQPKSSLTVKEMLLTSDNIGALRVAQTMPVIDFANTYQRFGLGKTTGVELADEALFSTKPVNEWSKVDVATASYGQGSISLTPIQLTAAWNTLASGGKYYKPTIVKSINDDGIVKEFTPVVEREVITPEAARDALRVSARGTSTSNSRAINFYKKYPFAGKTGTANIPKSDGLGYEASVVNTSYIGVAPLDNPKFTMLVWFREPRISLYGGTPEASTTAQPAWIEIADKLMLKLNVPPQGIINN